MYTIGQIAKKTGMTVRALRFYDEKGLLSPSHRTESGRKLYSNDDIVVLQNILTLKFLGYSLEQIHEVIKNRHDGLHQSLLRQKQEMVRKKEQIEKTIATLEHAIALAEKKDDVHIDIFLSLIHGIMMEDKQKAFLKTKLPEDLVHDLYDHTEEELIEYNKRFMEAATKLREAYRQQLPDQEVMPMIEHMINIIPVDLIERTLESSKLIEEDIEFDDSLFMVPFTKEEEEWLFSIIERMKFFERSEELGGSEGNEG